MQTVTNKRTLQEDLDNFKEKLFSEISEDEASKHQQFSKELTETDVIHTALRTGDKIPTFTLPNAVGNKIDIPLKEPHDYLIISFYRGEWCPFCNLEIKALQKHLPEFEKLNTKLIAISPQSPDKSLSIQQKHKLDFEVLSDVENKVGKKFGLVYTVAEYLTPIYENYGVGKEFMNKDGRIELPIAATYIIDSNGTIIKEFLSTDYTKRLEPKTMIETIEKQNQI